MKSARRWRPTWLSTLAGAALLAALVPRVTGALFAAAPAGASATPAAVAAIPAAARASASATAAASDTPRSALAALDTTRVARRTAGAGRPPDAFAAHSWFVAPPPAPPAPVVWQPPPEPPPPQAPPLPFKYLGRLQESAERTVWYLLQGERLVVAASGESVDDTYRIDGAEAGQLRLTYLPLGQQQSLTIGVSP
jgi:hypothetical protein